MTNDYMVLHSPFDFDTHNKTFINYCEVVIYPDGLIEYGVPSHQEKMFEVYGKNHGMTTEETKNYFRNDWDFFDKILDDTGLVLIWYDNIKFNKITDKQKEAIYELAKHKCIDSILLRML